MPKTKNNPKTEVIGTPFAPPHAGRTIYTSSIPRAKPQRSAESLSAYRLFCLTEVISKPDIMRGFLRHKWDILDGREKGFYAEAAERTRKEGIASILAIRSGEMSPYALLLKDVNPVLQPSAMHTKILKKYENGDAPSQDWANNSSDSDQTSAVDLRSGAPTDENISQMLWNQSVDPEWLVELERAYIDFSACEDFSGFEESKAPERYRNGMGDQY